MDTRHFCENTTNTTNTYTTQPCTPRLGADHLIPGGGGAMVFLWKKKIVQQIFENK